MRRLPGWRCWSKEAGRLTNSPIRPITTNPIAQLTTEKADMMGALPGQVNAELIPATGTPTPLGGWPESDPTRTGADARCVACLNFALAPRSRARPPIPPLVEGTFNGRCSLKPGALRPNPVPLLGPFTGRAAVGKPGRPSPSRDATLSQQRRDCPPPLASYIENVMDVSAQMFTYILIHASSSTTDSTTQHNPSLASSRLIRSEVHAQNLIDPGGASSQCPSSAVGVKVMLDMSSSSKWA